MRPTLRHAVETVVVLLGVTVALLAAAAWRLNRGPVPVNVLKPAIERRLAAQTPGGRASVGGVGLVWYGAAQSLGVQLDRVSVVDARGRPVLQAGQVQAALALDSVLQFAPAPGRLSAVDFFAAISVSPQGRYELGYDAQGAPTPGTGGLAEMFRALTGPARRSEPLSFLRDLELDRGRLSLRQTDGSLAWTGRIEQIGFHKAGGVITGVSDASIGEGEAQAQLKARAKAAVGLKDAYIEGTVQRLNPARIFPSAGVTRPLSALDAVIEGRGSLDYAAKAGVRAADVAFTAGAGRLRFGQSHQRFDSADVRASYDPGSGEVELQGVKLVAERTRLDVGGRLRLTPEGGGQPARLEFALQGPEVVIAPGEGASPQRLVNLAAKGRYTPELGRLELDDGRATLGHAPVAVKGVVFRGKNETSGWGAKLEAHVDAPINAADLFAYWPENLAGTARGWLSRSLRAADIRNIRFNLDLPPDALAKTDQLSNEMLRLTFDFAGVGFSIIPDMPLIQDGAGSGVLLGNRFDLTLKSGRMNDVALSEGSVEIPFLAPKGARAVFKARAAGEAQSILNIVDVAPTRLISSSGFDIRRVSGQGDVKIQITRPMLSDVPLRDFTFAYQGKIHGAGLHEAALGFDLKGGELTVDGAGARLSVSGPATVGPYRGGVTFQEVFASPKPSRSTIDLDGAIDLAFIGLSGAAGSAAPLAGHLTVENSVGEGVLRSKAFDGQLSWREGDQGAVTLRGSGDTALWRSVGLPLAKGVPDRLPLRLTLNNSPAGWAGRLDADAYSGAVLFIPGKAPRLRYATDISPDDARKLGLGGLPLFERTQSLVIDADLGGDDQGVSYALAGMRGRLGWASRDGRTTYRLKTVMTADDLRAIGLGGVLQPPAPAPVDAVVVSGPDGWKGEATVAGQAVRYQSGPPVGGRRTVSVSGDLDGQGLARLGAPAGTVSGDIALSGRLDFDTAGLAGGRIEADLGRAGLALPDTDWRKPAGQPSRAFVEFARRGEGVEISRLVAEGPGLEINARGAIAGGRLASLQTSAARLDGLFDGQVRVAQDAGRASWTVRGRYLDARRWLKNGGRNARSGGAAGGGQGGGSGGYIDAALDEVRVNRNGVLRSVKATGQWGGASPRLQLSATTAAGAALSARVYGDGPGSQLEIHASDVADVGKTLFGVNSLRGGEGMASGRLTDGGADLTLHLKNVRVARVPALAQILTVASLQGLADTLNGGGIEFSEIVAPLRLRGSQLTIDHARATGPGLGLTAQGVINTDADVMDLTGAIAPAYGVNSFLGATPILGPLLTSRKGEGVVGLTYTAKGPTASPRVIVNPLSIATPGILRRIFEGMPTQAEPAPAKPPAKSKAKP
ncbi:MAG: hypothetical protein IIZ63_00775 [Caulobacteraceae bacterium]|nr:hypothetical protein [Caulobacteraceae bacterium]